MFIINQERFIFKNIGLPLIWYRSFRKLYRKKFWCPLGAQVMSYFYLFHYWNSCSKHRHKHQQWHSNSSRIFHYQWEDSNWLSMLSFDPYQLAMKVVSRYLQCWLSRTSCLKLLVLVHEIEYDRQEHWYCFRRILHRKLGRCWVGLGFHNVQMELSVGLGKMSLVVLACCCNYFCCSFSFSCFQDHHSKYHRMSLHYQGCSRSNNHRQMGGFWIK